MKIKPLTQLREMIAAALSSGTNLSKSFRTFFIETMELFLTIPNRINFLQMGRFGHSSEQRFRMNFRKRFDWLSFNREFVQQEGNPRRRAIAIDPSHISKSGKKTPGVGYFWSGCASAVKWGLELMGFALVDADAVAEVSNAVVHLDEYKNNLDLEKREFLKGLWDGAGRSRMNMDNDKRRETTAVDCGVVMSGQEMPTADTALFNRLVFLTFSKTTFSDQEKRDYENLKLIEKRGLTHLTNRLLQLRSKFQTDFRRVWDETLAEMNDRVRSYSVEDRTLRNWAVLLASFRTLMTDIDVPFGYEEIFRICCKGCVDQNQKTRQNNELSGFWEIVENLVASGQAYINIDYKLCSGDRPFAIKESDVPFEPRRGTRYIYLAFQRLSALYMKEGKDVNGKVIPRDSLRYYLEHSPEFVGTARSMRFKLLENKAYVSSNPETGKSRVTTAMVFDYDALKVNYGIDLDISTDTLEDGDSRSAATTPPPVDEPEEAGDPEIWEQ